MKSIDNSLSTSVIRNFTIENKIVNSNIVNQNKNSFLVIAIFLMENAHDIHIGILNRIQLKKIK